MQAKESKPVLRGVSHAAASAIAIVCAGILVLAAPAGKATAVAFVYGIGLVGMYTVSALYHRITWGEAARRRMRRLDHSAIFVMIAGTGTPLFVLGVGGVQGLLLVAAVWTGAVLGILQSTLQSRRSTWIVAMPYVVVGWIGVAAIPALLERIGAGGIGLILGGGVLYTVGALIYAARRPNPLPKVFGYHEVFHALVIVASICHFVVVQDVVFNPLP